MKITKNFQSHIVILLLSLCISIILVGCNKDKEIKVFTYTQNSDGTITITGLTDKGKNDRSLKIPDQIDGKTVTQIGREAFRDDHNVIEISMGDNVTGVQENAFLNCYNLEKITFSNNLEDVGTNIVKNTAWEKKELQDNNEIIIGDILIEVLQTSEKYIIPGNVKIIGSGAFYNNTMLLEIELPAQLEKIGNYAFAGCTNLKEINIPKSVKKIGYDAFFGVKNVNYETETDTLKPVSNATDKVDVILTSMSLEEKVAQMFIITPEALTGFDDVTQASVVTKDALEQYPVGGIVYFSKNIESQEQLKKMIGNTKQYAYDDKQIPIFIAVDEEGGRVARLANTPSLNIDNVGPMLNVGLSKDINQAYKTGQDIATYLKYYGFNLDFAPDADVITNSDNVAIGDRSFGMDSELVTDMCISQARAFIDNGVLPCFKHFPGHGATLGDTHEGFAYSNKTVSQMEDELRPFRAAKDNNMPFIMVSHISLPNENGSNIPATLSYNIVSNLLRENIGYKGIVITDAMDMGAIVNNYNPDKAVIMALEAGVDMILMPQDFKSVFQTVCNEVSEKHISEERIDESVRRILEVKMNL